MSSQMISTQTTYTTSLTTTTTTIIPDLSHTTSSTKNTTLTASSDSADFLNEISRMLWCTVPVILLVGGTFGNMMIVVVMRKLRASPSTACLSVYFTALALSDQCLLTSVLWYWVDAVFTWPPSFYRYDLLCTVAYVVWYTTSETSAWFLVSMTFQRVTSVVAPHRVGVLCTVRRGKMVIAAIVTVACALNFQFLFTFKYSHEFGECVPRDTYDSFIYQFTMVDMFIASVIPFLLLLVGNSILIVQVIKSLKLSRKLKHTAESDASSERQTQVYPMTRTLIMTSAAFLVLTLPVCIFDAYKRSVDYETAAAGFVSVMNVAEAVTNFMWSAASASNFYLYLLSGRKFREEAKNSLSCCNSQ